MPQKIAVVPLAAESLGVRSMCTYIETPDLRVLLDAGVSLCPYRFRLPPHPMEFKAIEEARKKIAEYSRRAEVITISHYHFDHHTPSYEDWLCNWTDPQTAQKIYEDKLVLAKSYRSNINPSQRRRGWFFQKTGGKHARKVEFADDRVFHFGKTKMRFSSPVFHGLPNTPLGYVLMVTIEHEGEKVMFASDVQGPMDDATVKIILANRPQTLIIGGPPLYLEGFRIDEQHILRGFENLKVLAEAVPVVIVEHHLLRDLSWRESTKQIFKSAEKAGHNIVTAAEFLREEDKLFEAKRKQLFEDKPPSPEFERWSKLSEAKRKKNIPPI